MIACKSCRAEAHEYRDGYYMTGCDCVPLELVEIPTVAELSKPAREAWDWYLVALSQREKSVLTVEREWRGIIEQRRAAYMAAIEREKQCP